MTDRIKENLGATFNNCKLLKEETANGVVLVEDEKQESTELLFFAELAPWSLVVYAMKEDLSYQLTEATPTPTTHSTYTRAREEGMVGGARRSPNTG